MKITIYELLGMIKDGKAPKNARIRYFDRKNDYISKLEEIKDNLSLNKDKKETYLYEENSFQNMIVENKYYENKINELQDRIDKAIEYMNNYIKLEKSIMCESAREEFKEIINILEGKE